MQVHFNFLVLILTTDALLDQCSDLKFSSIRDKWNIYDSYFSHIGMHFNMEFTECVTECLLRKKCTAVINWDSSRCLFYESLIEKTSTVASYKPLLYMRDVSEEQAGALVGACASRPCKHSEVCLQSVPPTCTPWCAIPPWPEHGERLSNYNADILGGTTLGHVVTGSCNRGHMNAVHGGRHVHTTCLQDGTWSHVHNDDVWKCTAVQSCTDILRCLHVVYGTRDGLYRLDNGTSIHCQGMNTGYPKTSGTDDLGIYFYCDLYYTRGSLQPRV